jgi:hypothetical protein
MQCNAKAIQCQGHAVKFKQCGYYDETYMNATLQCAESVVTT